MTLVLPAGYHWSPQRCRKNITKRGLRPTTPTAVWVRPFRPGQIIGHHEADLPDQTLLAVCLGTSPSTAWALSGALTAERGETWDLWEVEIAEDDEVHYRPTVGHDLDELRVVNAIPRRQLWLVGHRTVGARRWNGTQPCT